jgi:hypothetical protein
VRTTGLTVELRITPPSWRASAAKLNLIVVVYFAADVSSSMSDENRATAVGEFRGA